MASDAQNRTPDISGSRRASARELKNGERKPGDVVASERGLAKDAWRESYDGPPRLASATEVRTCPRIGQGVGKRTKIDLSGRKPSGATERFTDLPTRPVYHHR
jgi:hypothetical protein